MPEKPFCYPVGIIGNYAIIPKNLIIMTKTQLVCVNIPTFQGPESLTFVLGNVLTHILEL